MLLIAAISYFWPHRGGRRALMAFVVLLATLCVLSIFFFPAQEGPYAVTHGPVTELRVLLPSLSLVISLMLLAAGCLRIAQRFSSFSALQVPVAARLLAAPLSLHQVLRC